MEIPKDAQLVQESLRKVAEGPEALMQWAKEHQDQIDAKFINMLGKMARYANRTNKPEIAKAFTFLQSCFDKMFDLPPAQSTLAITAENFRQVWQEAAGYLRQGKPNRALTVLEQLSVFFSQHPEFKCQSLLDANFGAAYAQLQQPDKAIKYLRAALTGELGPLEREKVLANLGTVYITTGDLPQALDCYSEAIAVAEQRGDLLMQIGHRQNLAVIYLEQKNLQRALSQQQQACELAEKTGDKRILQDSLTRLALLTEISGDYQKCAQLCKRALELLPPPE